SVRGGDWGRRPRNQREWSVERGLLDWFGVCVCVRRWASHRLALLVSLVFGYELQVVDSEEVAGAGLIFSDHLRGKDVLAGGELRHAKIDRVAHRRAS